MGKIKEGIKRPEERLKIFVKIITIQYYVVRSEL